MISNNSLPLNQHPAYVLLHQTFQPTKTHLSIADLNFGHPLIEQSTHIFSIFLQRAVKKLRSIPPKLKRLTLDIQLVQNSPLPLYNYLLKDLKHIEHLKITLCPNYGHHTPSYFQILLKTLRKARNLQALQVIVPTHFQWMEGNSMRSLIKTLSKSAPRLKDIRLIFEDGSGALAQEASKPLMNEWKIQRLAYLQQNLTLHLPRAAFLAFIAENEAKFGLSAFSRFKRLKSLDLAMVESLINPGPDCIKFIFEPPKTQLFPNLKRFQWNLLDSRLVEIEGLQTLGAELVRSFEIPSENFTLKFKQSGLLNDYGMDILVSQAFASLTTDLHQLLLTVRELDSKSSENLISALSGPKLRKMQVMYLESMDGKGMSDKFLEKFGKVLSHDLKYLRLRFEFNQESAKGFVGVLKDIFGGGEEGVTDKGMSRFGEILIENCKNLKFIWLEFGKYGKISDRGIKGLCESLSQIEGLKRMWLKFRLCGQVSMMAEKYAKEKLGEQREVKFELL